MKKLILIFCCILTASCGSGCFLFEDCDETQTFTYIIRNNTGTTAVIKVGDIQQEVTDDGTFECSYTIESTSSYGLCQGFLEIRFLSNGKGYRCHGTIQEKEGLCFIEDWRAFSISQEGGIFEEISPRIYEYVLTPDLVENAHELP